MYQVIYSSRCTQFFSDADVVSLLTQARENNARDGVTGILFYGAHFFLQVLEGEHAVLATLCEKLRRDARHTSMVYLADKPIARRSFEGWAMAFQSVSPTAVAGLHDVLTEAQVATQLGRMAEADRLLMTTMQRLLRAAPAASPAPTSP